MRRARWVGLAVGVILLTGCTRHAVDVKADTRHEVSISVKDPIHIKLDINVRIQKDLEDVFDFEDSGADEKPADAGEAEKAGKGS